MIRISTIFVAICMVLIAASLGAVVYSIAGFSAGESLIVAATALTLFVLYNAISMRLRDRADTGTQIADLSRGTADLARQVGELGRRLIVLEGKLASASSANQDRVQVVSSEIGELGVLVKQLATSVALHDEMLTAAQAASRPTIEPAPAPAQSEPPAVAAPVRPVTPISAAPPAANPALLAGAVREAVEAGRIDIYLQPMVSLPQRKVRFYEIVARLRDNRDHMLTPEDFLGPAEAAGLIGRIDHAVLLRAVQVLRRLLVRNKEVGVFVNAAAATLSHPEIFTQCLDFLDANRALAASLVLEFRQSTFRNLSPAEAENLAALAQRGYRFSIDHVTDLRFEPRELADRGVRFIKVPAALLLDHRERAGSDIHPADLADLLGRFGIDLIAERIEGERAVVDLLDYDVRFGQGFLFAAPRPLRPENAPATSAAATPAATDQASQDTRAPHDKDPPTQSAVTRADPARASGNAALARRAAGPF